MRNFIWWAFYVIAAIWLQRLVPGLDALVPGLLICMKERRQQQTIIFLLVCVFFQEGCGTLPFGSSIAWYGFVFACYYIGSWFFLVDSRIFMLLISAAIGLGRAFTFYSMGLLQTQPVDSSLLTEPALAQGLLTPIIWGVAAFSRRRFLGENNSGRRKGLEFRT